MHEADVPAAAIVSAEAFDLDISAPDARARWERRVCHSLVSDPEGSFVAERDGAVVGLAQAVQRDRLWILSLMTVSPTTGRGGEGRALMDAAVGYGAARTDGGLIIASNHPRALRLYASSGFLVEPTFRATGVPRLSLIPDPDPRVTVVERSDLPHLAQVSRAVRGAEHTPDFAVAYDWGATIFALEDRGFVVAIPGRGVWALAALDEQAATTLLWRALHHLRDEPRIEVGFITGDQQWALDVLVAARLLFTSYGGVCRRGQVGRLHPYIPSPTFA